MQKRDDTSEQSKLASFGFIRNENVRKLRPVGFAREFEDEDNLLPDDDEMGDQNFDRRSLSPTPRKAQAGKVLGAVPVPPIDPRLRPAGIKELQRREKLRKMNTDGGASWDDKLPGEVVSHTRNSEIAEDEAVPSSQPSENQQEILNSDSSTDMRWRARLEEIQAPPST